AERIAKAFGAHEYTTRADARAAIEPLLSQNYSVFSQYGPDSDASGDPESELALQWERKVLVHVFPNNRLMLAILDANRKLLQKEEVTVLDAFRQHVDDLEARHLGDEYQGGGVRFPTKM